jgi:hypothetical protein
MRRSMIEASISARYPGGEYGKHLAGLPEFTDEHTKPPYPRDALIPQL